jgi:hypothetical protein
MRRMILCASLGFFSVLANSQNRFEVLITEIFADPSPPVGLPNYEWIEIKNVSASPVSLSGWRLSDAGSQSGAFPNYNLAPDSSLVICSSTALPHLAAYGPAISVSSFPSLDNIGDMIALKSSTGKSIHAIQYELSWYGNELKEEGGWSLEMIDPGLPCLGKKNWRASENHSGGTPSRKNSVNEVLNDTEAPAMLRSYASDSLTFRVVFTEPVDSLSAGTLTNYSIHGNTAPQSVTVIPPLFMEAELKLSVAVMPNEILMIRAVNIRDCKGNIMSNAEIPTGLASIPEAGEWVINEVMFDPRPNGYDYVEFYNNSNRILDLAELYIANRNSSGTISGITPLSEYHQLVFPHQFSVVTADADRLALHYHVKNSHSVSTVNDLPSYPDDKGTVVAVDRQGRITDELHYDRRWHFKLISDPEGVSLERIDHGTATQDPMNWHSASSGAGYGTPGYENSQYRRPEFVGKVTVDPLVFSPDNDGRDDVLMINYELPAPGYMSSVSIYDYSGRLVRSLVQNQLAGRKGSWIWDGLENKGMKLPLGIYVVLAEFFNLDGLIEKIRLPVVIAKPY